MAHCVSIVKESWRLPSTLQANAVTM